MIEGTVAPSATVVNYSDILSDIGRMSDHKLVEFVQTRVTKFAREMRPLFIEVEERFKRSVHIKHKAFLGKYTNWDTFCVEVLNFSGRHVRRIIAGEAMPTLKEPGAAGAQTKKAYALWSIKLVRGKTRDIDERDIHIRFPKRLDHIAVKQYAALSTYV